MVESLRHLALIVEFGSYTAAAEHAHLSQPALSASIKRLEAEVGLRLLHRGRRGARLTAAGEVYFEKAMNALRTLEQAARAAHDVANLEGGEVRIGAGGTACAYLLPPTLGAFSRAHPKVLLKLRELTSDEARVALDRDEIDIAVVTADEGEFWFEDELTLVGPPQGSPQAVITFRAGSTSRALLDEHFPEADVRIELGGVAAVKAHVRAGIGIALLSRHATQADRDAGTLVEIDDARTPVRRAFHLLHQGVDRLPPAALALREALLLRA